MLDMYSNSFQGIVHYNVTYLGKRRRLGRYATTPRGDCRWSSNVTVVCFVRFSEQDSLKALFFSVRALQKRYCQGGFRSVIRTLGKLQG